MLGQTLFIVFTQPRSRPPEILRSNADGRNKEEAAEFKILARAEWIGIPKFQAPVKQGCLSGQPSVSVQTQYRRHPERYRSGVMQPLIFHSIILIRKILGSYIVVLGSISASTAVCYELGLV